MRGETHEWSNPCPLTHVFWPFRYRCDSADERRQDRSVVNLCHHTNFTDNFHHDAERANDAGHGDEAGGNDAGGRDARRAAAAVRSQQRTVRRRDEASRRAAWATDFR